MAPCKDPSAARRCAPRSPLPSARRRRPDHRPACAGSNTRQPGRGRRGELAYRRRGDPERRVLAERIVEQAVMALVHQALDVKRPTVEQHAAQPGVTMRASRGAEATSATRCAPAECPISTKRDASPPHSRRERLRLRQRCDDIVALGQHVGLRQHAVVDRHDDESGRQPVASLLSISRPCFLSPRRQPPPCTRNSTGTARASAGIWTSMRWSAIIAVGDVTQQAARRSAARHGACRRLAFEFAVRAALFDALAQRTGFAVERAMSTAPERQNQCSDGLHAVPRVPDVDAM
jgi:hypothetical protein